MRELNVLLRKAFSGEVYTSILLVPIACTFYWFGERCFVWVLYISVFFQPSMQMLHSFHFFQTLLVTRIGTQRDLIVGIAKGNYHDVIT